ncbi:MAG TPA: PH domain-containing protein [Candidatus Paceibacterota bacterium]|jgi:uncharacterized membrane protein YdbT with pleckstrin-like domain
MEEFELEPGEQITIQVRQHIFVLFLRLIPPALLAIAPFIVLPVFQALLPGEATQAGEGLSPYFRFFVGIWWLFLWMHAFHIITKYFLNVWVITSHRIVDIHQLGFFRRRVSSFLLLHIQDVTTNVHGIFQTIVGFGDINVETAGNSDCFCMKGIRTPEEIRDIIMTEVAKLHHDEYNQSVIRKPSL